MFGLVGCTTMRPMAPDFSRPTRFHVSPPSVDLKMPQPGEIVLRESSSPVPAHTCIVSDGAIASSPIDTHFSLSNTGRNVVPALVVFQIPPAAAATKNVRDGLGMPATLDTRPPMFAGPMLRQRNPASSVESRVMAPAFETPVVTTTVLGAGRCGRGNGRCARCARVVSVEDGGGCGGGAGGFWESVGLAMTVRTAAAAHRRWNMTALVKMCFGCGNRAANGVRMEGARRWAETGPRLLAPLNPDN